MVGSVQPEDIESVINSHPDVSQSFIIPIDDVQFGQRPVAVIEANESVDLNQLADWLKIKLLHTNILWHFIIFRP